MHSKQLLELGRSKCDVLIGKHPNSAALSSVLRQIEYLIGIADGSISDRSRLKEITIGVVTAREIEALDMDAAETFYQIASEAKLM